MKKLVYLLVTMALMGSITLASCTSFGGGAKADTPTATFEKYVKTLQDGNYDKVVDMLADADQATDEERAFVVELFKAGMEELGGIKSCEVLEETIAEDGNTAKLKVKYTYGNGEEKEGTETLVKTEEGWGCTLL